jgi:hypothetical protein
MTHIIPHNRRNKGNLRYADPLRLEKAIPIRVAQLLMKQAGFCHLKGEPLAKLNRMISYVNFINEAGQQVPASEMAKTEYYLSHHL